MIYSFVILFTGIFFVIYFIYDDNKNAKCPICHRKLKIDYTFDTILGFCVYCHDSYKCDIEWNNTLGRFVTKLLN